MSRGNLSYEQDVLRSYLLDNKIEDWDVSCHTAAFDCIHDVDVALDAYHEDYNNTSSGSQILFVYGSLQALVVLIDAVTCVYRSFKDNAFKRHDNRIFKKCIDFRDMVVGHPIVTGDKHSKLPGFSHFILRHTISEDGVFLQSRNSNDPLKWEKTIYRSLIL